MAVIKKKGLKFQKASNDDVINVRYETDSKYVLNSDGTTVQQHVDNTGKHVSSGDREKWDGMIPTSQKGISNGVATLDDNGKVPLGQISDSIMGNVIYKGLWNPSTNDKGLTATPEREAIYYICTANGSKFSLTFVTGDWIISQKDNNGNLIWGRVGNSDAVTTVAGKTGNVTLTKSDVGLDKVANERQYSASNPPPYPVKTVAGRSGVVTLEKADVGLGNVSNTSDIDKPISTATQDALDNKLNKNISHSITDANLMSAPGFYYVYAPTGSNIPSGYTSSDTYFHIFSNGQTQTATVHYEGGSSGAELFIRTLYRTSPNQWTPWVKISNQTLSGLGGVPTTRKVNGKALSGDIILAASDISGVVPDTRKINTKPLSGNITLTASDVGAVPTTRTVNGKALSSNIKLTASDLIPVGTAAPTAPVAGDMWIIISDS